MRVTGWTAATAVVVAIGLAAVVVTATYAESNCLPWQDRVSAELTIETAESRRGRVHASGTTDLPDGALLGYWVVPESELGDVVGDLQHQVGGQTTVRDGRFRISADVTGWPEGRTLVEVWFSVSRDEPQPEHVTAAFGDNGQCMTGRQVGVDSPGDPKVLHTDTRVIINQ